MLECEAEETVAGGGDGLAAGGEYDGGPLVGGRPVLADHLRTRACGLLQEEAIEFLAA